MLLPSKYNMMLARMGYLAVAGVRRLCGSPNDGIVRRGGVNWRLDLREGLDLTIYVTGYFQRGVVDACRALLTPGAVAIDIGANMGGMTLHMAQAVGSRGRVYAIEPTRYPFERMERNIAVNPDLKGRIEAHRVFLVARNDDPIPAFLPSSWRVAGDRTAAHPVHRGVPQETTGTTAWTLDDFVEQKQIERLDLIKLDVDGAEDEILAGGEQTLKRFRPPIVIEVAPYTLEDRGLAGDAPLQRLRQIGYHFESLRGERLESDHRAWVKQLAPGYGRDIVARFS